MQRQCLDGPINSYHSFLWSNLILCLHNVDILNICIKEFGSEKYYLQNDSYENLDNFPDCITKGLCLFYHSAYTGRSTPFTSVDGTF